MPRLYKLLGLLIILIVTLFTAVFIAQQNLKAPLKISQPEFFSVQKGSTGYSVLNSIDQNGWLRSHPIAVKLWLKFFYNTQSVKAGMYQIEPGKNITDVFEKLARGEEHQFSVSLVEGLTYSQWLVTLSRNEYLINDIDKQTEQQLLSAWPWVPSDGINNLEGLLLANTYYFTAGTPVSEILKRAMRAMHVFLDATWQQRASGLPFNHVYEALILASIVEKETAVAAERNLIAGVFVNRLEANMRLQTDPTVIYGIGSSFDGNLTRQHLRQRTAYNTYVIKGLPPTPIAMAGKEAIRAALHPEQTEHLYFVAKGDGSHHFSSSLQEHNDAVYKYQIKRNK